MFILSCNIDTLGGPSLQDGLCEPEMASEVPK